MSITSYPTGASTDATLSTMLQEGADITGASMPTGGTHGRGWLSAIWKLLAGGLPAALTGSGNLKAAIVESTATVTTAINNAAATGKGTQGANFVPVQDAHDAGRQQFLMVWERQAGGASESATATCTALTVGGAVQGVGKSYAVGVGKTLRITQVIVTLRTSATTTGLFNSRVRIRQGTANTDPIIWQTEMGFDLTTTTMVVDAEVSQCHPIPEGLEVGSGSSITMTHLESSATGTVSISVIGYIY